MRNDWIKLGLTLAILLLLDITKPMKYSITAEFIFLGVLFAAINCPPILSFPAAAISGYLKDCVGIGSTPFYLVEFVLMVMVTRFFIHRISRGPARILTVLGAIIAHVIINSYHYGIFSARFFMYFVFHSAAIFLLLNFLLKKWTTSFSKDYI